MANTEDRDLDNILIEKKAPTRVEAKKEMVAKKAKLTSRTIASLKEKIKESRLDKAYAKYNKKYQKMKQAAREASNAQKLQAEGADITDSELAVDYSVVASYDKKLARMGAKLLKEDIKKIAASTDVSDKAVVGKRIKVPRFLLTKMKGLVASIERIRTKKEQKKIAKEITKETKEYIKNSLDGALFKEDGSLQEKIDSKVIQNLSLKGGKNDTERRLDTLKGFISLDGKNSLFAEKDGDSELGRDNKTNTGLPPVEPESTVAKEEPKINVDDLLKGFEKKTTAGEDVNKTTTGETSLKEESVDTKNKEITSVREEVKNIGDPQKREVEEILRHASNINQIRATLKKTTDPEVKKALEIKLIEEKDKFNSLISVDSKNSKKAIIEDDKKSLEPVSVEPNKATVVSKDTVEENDKIGVMGHVEVKQPESIRVAQVAAPAALRVTAKDIKTFEERIKNAQLEIARLTKEEEELKNKKAMLQEYIAKATMVRDFELQVKNKTEGNAALKGEVDELNTKAVDIHSSLGRSK